MSKDLPSYEQVLKYSSDSELVRKNQHIKKLWELSGDTSLFHKKPEELEKLRMELFRESIKFFSEKSDFYDNLFKRLGIDSSSADREDLIKLAIPSDLLRGDSYRKLTIIFDDNAGFVFSSSGTSNSIPVRIYRNYIELAMMTRANAALFEYVYGSKLVEGGGLALFLAAKELRSKLNFVAFVDLALQSKKIPLLYGMDLVDSGNNNGSQWKRLVPNKQTIMEFIKSNREPKLLFTAPAGVYLLSKQFLDVGLLKRLLMKLSVNAPPINLGSGGVIVTGGGSKGMDLPPYNEVVNIARKVFKAKNNNGEEVPVPFMDVLGMTETLTALIDKFGVMNKIPHPLQEVIILDPSTLRPVEEPGKRGLLMIYDPLAISWLEAFIPGDIVSFNESNSYYGKEFIYVRRLTKEEGWELQRACGGTLEELMKS